MTDPLLELQGAVVARLKTDAGVAAFVGGRVFDDVPLGAERPYIAIGPSEAADDSAECIGADEFALQIDCWSEAPGFVEVRRLGAAVRKAMIGEFALTENALVSLDHRITRVFRDRGGTMSQAAITFSGVIERAD